MNWAASTLDVGGTVIHVRRGGTPGARVVVCAHGFSDDGACWSRVADRLVDRFDIVAVDARNHGRSGRGPADWTILADDLAGVITTLGLDRPALVGHSLGASTVALVAARYPELAARVVLEDPPWRIVQEPPEDGELAGVRAWVASLAGRSLGEIRRMGREQHPSWPDAEFDSWAPAKLRLGERAVEHLTPIDWRWAVDCIEAPLLLVIGDPALDAIATREVGDLVERRRDDRGAETHIELIDGAGHNVRREQLDAYLAVVAPFLDRG